MIFTSLKDVLIKRAERLFSKNKATLIVIEDIWGELVQNNKFSFLAGTSPISFKKGKLSILCFSSAEAANLQLHKKDIIKKINSLLKEELVKDIQFKIK